MQLRRLPMQQQQTPQRHGWGGAPSCFPAPSCKPRPAAAGPRRYQQDEAAASKAAPSSRRQVKEVTAEDTFRAAAANMPTGAWAGRWERWGPPPVAKGGIVHVDDNAAAASAGWQLLTSGQSVYVFKPSSSSSNSLSVSVMEATDSESITMVEAAAAQLMTEVVLGGGVAGAAAGVVAEPVAGGATTQHTPAAAAGGGGVKGDVNVMRADNSFSEDDHFFRPYLPDHTQPGGDSGLRLWAADSLGFVMAPTALPHSMMHTQPTAAAAAGARPGQEQQPFVANMYIKHPSKEPGVGRRWGWNLQFGSSLEDDEAAVAAHQAGPLQHIHHTSLGLVRAQQQEQEQEVESLLRPGPHTTPPTASRSLPPSIAAFMSVDGRYLMMNNGSAVSFSYDGGRLVREDIDICSWGAGHIAPAPAGGVSEVWYSSGGYTRCPVSLQAELSARRPVTIEAGAILYNSRDASDVPMGVARWLLTYRAGDGQLDTVRLEVYKQQGGGA